MKIAYFDLIAGASGDMILGALIDAGLPAEILRDHLSAVKISDFNLNIRRVIKNGFSATKVDVLVKEKVPARHLLDIEGIIENSELPSKIQEKAINIFQRLAEVEANIHDMSLDEIHLHELGGVDTIVDVVGTLVGLGVLEIDRIVVSPFPLGRGFVHGAHGEIPLPAPATLALLEGVPVFGVDLDFELVTPTGAVLLTSLGDSFGPIPPMKIESVGYGAGGRDLSIPNLLRLIIGIHKETDWESFETLVMLESNIDDLNPEIYNHVMDLLFASGAKDVFLTPIQMKKNRPAILLQVLAKPRDVSTLRDIMFRETSTLGIRQRLIERYALRREIQNVVTPYGVVRIKIAYLTDGSTKAAPEYEDCQIIAKNQNIPIHEVYNAALAAHRNLS